MRLTEAANKGANRADAGRPKPAKQPNQLLAARLPLPLPLASSLRLSSRLSHDKFVLALFIGKRSARASQPVDPPIRRRSLELAARPNSAPAPASAPGKPTSSNHLPASVFHLCQVDQSWRVVLVQIRPANPLKAHAIQQLAGANNNNNKTTRQLSSSRELPRRANQRALSLPPVSFCHVQLGLVAF